MKTFCLLLLALVAATESRPKLYGAGKILLQEIIESVNEIFKYKHPDKIAGVFVSDVFQAEGCSEKALCQAGLALNNTPLEQTILQRQLMAYAVYRGHGNCSNFTTEEFMMRDLLQKIKSCAREQYSKTSHHEKLAN